MSQVPVVPREGWESSVLERQETSVPRDHADRKVLASVLKGAASVGQQDGARESSTDTRVGETPLDGVAPATSYV